MDATAQLNTALSDRYLIEREVGAGGMATVYLGRDLRHDRRVAIKVLNAEIGAVLGVERFLAEIRVTAGLQHPNLLPLFDSGEADGLLFYVMPYVEGETLRSLLNAQKQLPVEDAVHIAVSVASALDHAHRHGVIHRDLKPENILLHEGQPLVADFGIALAVSRAGGNRITQTGISLGTPAYMSPEQATGDRQIDGRTDVYSLGAVLYEMLTGEPPHLGNTAQAVIARVLTEAPDDVRVRRPAVPEYVAVAVQRALEKLPADRFASAREFADALTEALPVRRTVPRPTTSASGVMVSRRMMTAAAGVVAMMVLATVWSARSWWVERASAPGATLRFPLPLPGADAGHFVAGDLQGHNFAISPNGMLIAFLPTMSGPISLRSLADGSVRALAGTNGARQPVFSPDGRWIAYVAGGQFRKISLENGTVMPLAEAPITFGLTWTGTGGGAVIAAAPHELLVVPENGGAARHVAIPDSISAMGPRWPCVLPDGQTVMFNTVGGSRNARIAFTSLATGRTTLTTLAGTSPLGIVDGRLIYANETGWLMAARLDSRGSVAGTPAAVHDPVGVGALGASRAALSASGTLVYVGALSAVQVNAVDGRGTAHPLIPEFGPFQWPRLSPDGRRLALVRGFAQRSDIWIYDLAAQTFTRLTTEGAFNDRPEWTPDGKRVLFRTNRGTADGTATLWWQPADGSGPAEQLLAVPGKDVWEGVLTRDGAGLVYRHGTDEFADVYWRALRGDTAVKPLATTRFAEWGARISPDGHWLAYGSDESGAFEIYVRPFPGSGPRVQVSTDGGEIPLWSRDGRALYYMKDRRIMRAAVTTSPTFAVHERTVAYEGEFWANSGHSSFDVMPDGRLLLLIPAEGELEAMVIHNWGAELRRQEK